ncbi:response regulator [Microbacterium gallinarum]|uniref:Transcriptional regulatory protein n=1 Tax=Microbacterium gallinarum TaxID=2762209 RepID=A0ABR8WY55_9MICO|nr:response regulator [Microbacterium gallinarum]MBD8022021.1 response regulator [Microbacterium gallinarum]
MIRVLLVDDDALTLELHRSYIERLDGFGVTGECTGARAAITALVDRGDDFDLVLLDITMPDGTGVDVLRRVRARGARVDVVAITGVRDAEVVRTMVGLGVAQYLVKPFTFATFRERMEQYREFRRRAEQAAGTATQSEIDALLGALRPATSVALPKGLSSATLERVTQDVRENGPVSAGEAAQRLGISRVSARRYLEHLAAVGRVARSPRYGTPGRPESEYAWSGG